MLKSGIAPRGSAKVTMWIVIQKAPWPDATPWPGRRLLAVVDAVAWPTGWLIAVSVAPKPGLFGQVVGALLVLLALQRISRALFRNERYRFTTWRWGVPLIALLAVGAVTRALA